MFVSSLKNNILEIFIRLKVDTYYHRFFLFNFILIKVPPVSSKSFVFFNLSIEEIFFVALENSNKINGDF